MGIVGTALRSLFPKGSAWALPGNVGQVVEGLGDSLERVHAFSGATVAESRPGAATLTLPEWHTALGRKYDPLSTVAFQQRMLAAVLTARGGVGLNDLNGQMHKELSGVNFAEIGFNGATDIAGEAECGGAECNSTVAGTDANPTAYMVTGTVQDDAEAARVASVIAHYAPLHLQPTSTLVILSDNGTTECGIDACGIAECNYAP